MKKKQLKLKKTRWIVCFLACVAMLLLLSSTEARAESKPNYLTFTAEDDDSTIDFDYVSGTNVQYSTDGGETWNDYEKDKLLKFEKKGDKICFRGKDVKTDSFKGFGMSGRISASGSVTSLTDENGGDTNVVLTEGCYSNMFSYCRSLISAPELPATTLAVECYESMFAECTSLTSAPALPATTMEPRCYKWMFAGCTSLVNAPALPATILAEECYDKMFISCTSLTSAPELPARTLAKRCYSEMFCHCSSLTSAPVIHAITLAERCCFYMFMDCRSLASAPALPATTLADYCYYFMFGACSSLASAPALPATTLADHCYESMFIYCSGLTSAPELPATTLADSCYRNMFRCCNKLNISTKKEGGQEWSLPTPKSGSTAEYWNLRMFSECPNVNFDETGSKEPQFGVIYYQKIPGLSEEEKEPDQKPENAPDDTQENRPENAPDDTQDNKPGNAPDDTQDNKPGNAPDDTQENKPGNTPDNTQDNTSELIPENNYDNEKDYRFTIPVAQAGTKVAAYQGCNFYEDSNGTKRCYDDSGVPIINEFKCDGTYTYYFQLDGTCMKSRLSYHPDGEHVIYLDENGHEVFSNFANVKQTIEGNAVDDFCFFDVHGYLYVDVVTFNQTGTKLYYANQYGVMERSKWFEFSDTCKWADGNPFDKAGGKYGYAMEDGSLMTNTATYDWEGRLCYMQGNGVAKY